jgi:CheY-like chemotaxis protein
MSNASLTRHLSVADPRVLVVDGSKVVRRLLERVLEAQLPEVTVHSCETGVDAIRELDAASFDFVSTALRLPDMDGLELARRVREHPAQAYIPIVLVSGDVQQRLVAREIGDDVTDYFDKSLGFEALAEFIRGYVRPAQGAQGTVLYVEDSQVVALATRRILEQHGFEVFRVATAEEAVERVAEARTRGVLAADVVLTDLTLRGELTGADLLDRIRGEFAYAKGELPVLVMTGDDNPHTQAELLRAGANDLVSKPVEERLLATKLGFQLRVARHLRERRDRAVGAASPPGSGLEPRQ